MKDSLWDDLKQHVVFITHTERPSPAKKVALIGIYALSLLYKLGVHLKDKKLKKEQQLVSPLPVVSIGNIVAGGTGKTPFVLLLLSHFNQANIGVISTGYRGKSVVKEYVKRVETTDPKWALQLGDEPYLIKLRSPLTPVYVCKDRMKSLELAYKDQCKLVFLDDGFQFRKVKKNLDIVMVDSHNPFDNHYHLPRGLLRESPAKLAHAEYVVLHHIESNEHFERAVKSLNCYTKAKILGCRWEPKKLIGLSEMSLEALKGKKIGVFCGIGNPSQFLKLMHTLGAHVVKEWTLADHVSPSITKLHQFSKECASLGAEILICTEKDYVKLQHIELMLPAFFLEAELTIVEGKEVFKELCEKIKHLAQL